MRRRQELRHLLPKLKKGVLDLTTHGSDTCRLGELGKILTPNDRTLLQKHTLKLSQCLQLFNGTFDYNGRVPGGEVRLVPSSKGARKSTQQRCHATGSSYSKGKGKRPREASSSSSSSFSSSSSSKAAKRARASASSAYGHSSSSSSAAAAYAAKWDHALKKFVPLRTRG